MIGVSVIMVRVEVSGFFNSFVYLCVHVKSICLLVFHIENLRVRLLQQFIRSSFFDSVLFMIFYVDLID